MKIEQTVQVRIAEARRAYTFSWTFDPSAGERALQVGDRVEIPGNMVNEEGGSAVVSALGSDYSGPTKSIIRIIPERTAPEDDLWAGMDVV